MAEEIKNNAPEEEYDEIITIPDPEVHALVKAADKLSAYIKCLEELAAGNREFSDAARETREALDALDLREVRWFLEHCGDAFGLTLDALQG